MFGFNLEIPHMLHIHETPSLFVTFTNTLIGSQLWNKSATESKSKRGSTSCFYPKPRVHRVWTADTTVFHVMDIEILATTTNTTSHEIQNPNLELLANKEKAKIFWVKDFLKESPPDGISREFDFDSGFRRKFGNHRF